MVNQAGMDADWQWSSVGCPVSLMDVNLLLVLSDADLEKDILTL